MRKLLLVIGCMAALFASIAIAVAAPVTFTPFAFTFNNPIGIDFQDTPSAGHPNGQLIMSVNYFNGTPHNLDLVDATTGTPTQFSSLSGLSNELKIATVRASACQGGFTDGEVFTGNGNLGQIVRISPDGSSVLNPWVNLGGAPFNEPAIVRGSLFQDRFCSANGDLIVVTGNEQTGFAANDSVGNVYRVTSAGTATKVATIGTHLEGVVTVPNLPSVFGPAAGKILAGAEEFQLLGRPNLTAADYNPDGGAIYVVDPNAVDVWFTISNGHSAAAACTLDASGHATPNHCNFHTANAFHPEDIDLIRRASEFFGVAFQEGHVLTSTDFDQFCGQVLITQELPFAGTSGLSAFSWSGTNFVIQPITSNRDGTIVQWEHVTFTSGQDCNTQITIAKTPDNATFNIGDALSFTIVVTNTGNFDATGATLNDPLPTTGGLTWAVDAGTTTFANCSVSVAQVLTCGPQTLAAGASVTVTVKTTNGGGAPAGACTGQKLLNTATATSTSTVPASVQDTGDYTCTPQPPHLKVVKTPDGGTFNQGGAVSFSIVVSNDGGSTATNAKLSDQLPTAGGLSWFGATVTTGQGSCSIDAASLLTCTFGSIAAGGSVTVTVSLSSTPVAACRSQSNPVALATADGGLSAQDAGSLTCTPSSLIAPTETTCQQFANGTASTLAQVNYSVSGGKIAQGINPGVFFYYAKITLGANTTVTVSESQNDAAALFQIQQGQARLYKADCSSFTTGTVIAGSTGASFTIATAGTYIISVKYSTKSIAGTAAPTSDPVTYTFTATPPGASTSASVLLKKQ